MQHVEAHPRDHCGQPSTQVRDGARVATEEMEPDLLHGILCLGERTEHPISHRPQAGTLRLKLLRQKGVYFHRSHLLVSFCHRNDKRNLADVTGRRSPTVSAPTGRPVKINPKRQTKEITLASQQKVRSYEQGGKRR